MCLQINNWGCLYCKRLHQIPQKWSLFMMNNYQQFIVTNDLMFRFLVRPLYLRIKHINYLDKDMRKRIFCRFLFMREREICRFLSFYDLEHSPGPSTSLMYMVKSIRLLEYSCWCTGLSFLLLLVSLCMSLEILVILLLRGCILICSYRFMFITANGKL